MTYVDTFVLAVPTANFEAYKQMAEAGAAVFIEHGAVHFMECWGDDVPDGEVTSFPMAVKAGDDETVAIGWIVWPSKEARDAGMAKAMEDPRLIEPMQDAPFDGRRMFFGGFRPVVDRRAG